MIRPLFLGTLCAALLVLPSAVTAQQKVVISYSTLGMNQLLDGSLIDVNSDGANRVWAVTPGRVSAALGTDRVPLFPITVADAGLVPGTSFRAVAFAVPAGNSSDGEHFYLGSSRGIAWGRLAANVDHRGILRVSAALIDADVVNGVSTDGSDWLWAATNGGLVLWDLGQGDPASPGPADTFLDAASDLPIQHVAVAPWGEALAVGAGAEQLWRVSPQGGAVLVRDLGTSGGQFGRVTFDANGNLWALTTLTSGGNPLLFKFESNATPTDPPTGFTGVERQFPLNPFFGTGTGAPAGFSPTDIAVDRFTGRVWVTTRSNQGPMGSAYFQDPVNAFGDLETDPTVNNWGEVISTFDRHTVVHADASGNAWFGMAGSSASSEALNGYLIRLLTLDRSRYLGADTGVATLLDLTLAGAGSATLSIGVGSDRRDFDPAEAPAGSGTFVQTFQIVPAGASGGTGNVFLVGSSTADVPVTATYDFTDANLEPQQLVASASWANIVPFEDDLLIGGPCFLHLLGW